MGFFYKPPSQPPPLIRGEELSFREKTMSNTPEIQLSENELIAQRQQKLAELRTKGQAFPNDFRRDSYAQNLQDKFAANTKEELEAGEKQVVSVAGRIMLKRVMGKASFITVQDMTGRIQFYVAQNSIGEDVYADFKTWDIGDIVGGQGYIFKTKTGELSIHIEQVRLLTKSLRPLPDKFRGLADQEIKYRQRYVDLIMNQETRNAFKVRSQVIDGIRRFLRGRDFMEVETPMMHVIPGGAAAKPFETHHNALDMPLFLRIAPELYLKRLVVGGFERVFEINRNFRNEGVSTRHNPEFTMIEFYQAYADYKDLMDLTEAMLKTVAQEVLGKTEVDYQGEVYDFGAPFVRMSMVDAILHYNPQYTREQLWDMAAASQIVEKDIKEKVKPT